MSSILERVQAVVAKEITIPEGVVVTLATRFEADLDADSLEVLSLQLSLEEEFNIDIPDEDAENLATVGDVVRYLEDHPKESPA